MKNDKLKTILTSLAEQEMPAAEIDIWPALQAQLTMVRNSQKGSKPLPSLLVNNVFFRRAVPALLLITISLGILFGTPQGRAIGQSILNYFTTASQKLLPLRPMPVPVPTYPLESEMAAAQSMPASIEGCGAVVSPISSTFICQLQEIQLKLGYTIKSFSARYVDAPFHDMAYSLENKSIRLSFQGEKATYTLQQLLGDFPAEQVGYAIYQDAIQMTKVGASPAEYAQGAYIFSEGSSVIWSPAEPVYHLRWKEGEISYSFTMGLQRENGEAPDGMIETMTLIAENLATLDQGADQLTAGHQTSLKDRAGFIIKEPGILPKNYHQVFDTGWNVLIPNKVNMLYEYRENGAKVGLLEFSQIPIPADEKNLRWEFSAMYQREVAQEDLILEEKVQINGAAGQYLVSSGDYPPQALYWRDNEREYILICQWASDFGGRLRKEDLIAIAESIH